MIKRLIFCLILVIYPITSLADKSACKLANKKKIICEYRGGKWKNGKCVYKKRRRTVKRRYFRVKRKPCNCKRIIRKTVRIVNSCNTKVVVIGCILKKEELKKVAPIVLIQNIPPKIEVVKKSDFFDWDLGAGAFALGIFNTQESRFLTGFYGSAVFRLWDRISLSGFFGGSVWQDTNIYISNAVGFRIYKRLSLTGGLHLLLGDFAGSRVRRRLIFGSVGAEYLFIKRINVSLETLFGLKSFVPPACYEQVNDFMIGVMLKTTIYFK